MADMERMARVLLKMRDKKAEINREAKEKVEAIDKQMDELNAAMLQELQALNVKSLRTNCGTIYTQDTIMPRAEDWQTVFDWVKENNGFDIFERRLKKKFVEDYIAEHDLPPPGVSVQGIIEVHVRRK